MPTKTERLRGLETRAAKMELRQDNIESKFLQLSTKIDKLFKLQDGWCTKCDPPHPIVKPTPYSFFVAMKGVRDGEKWRYSEWPDSAYIHLVGGEVCHHSSHLFAIYTRFLTGDWYPYTGKD